MDTIYKNKKVFVTGHTGFKGGWLCMWLKKLGARVYGYSLKPSSDFFNSIQLDKHIEKSIFGDILDFDKLYKEIDEIQPQIIFHLAAQPLVRKSYSEPVLTYKTNVMGTLNLLEASRKCSCVKAFVNITTDKCYENKEEDIDFKETDPLGGWDMYSSSKACSEILSDSYRKSFLENSDSFLLATARAGNVIGGGDWAEDRLIPDCFRALFNNEAIEIRNPNSKRPWQFVLEPLSGYLLLGSKLLSGNKEYAQAFNFGPKKDSVIPVCEIAKKIINYSKPNSDIKIHNSNLHEAKLLSLNINKAKEILGWIPTYNIDEAIRQTADWYRAFYGKKTNMYKFSLKQIDDFEGSITWNKN